MKHEQKFYWLDLLRGMAALFVFVGHVRSICIEDIYSAQLTLPKKIFFLATGFAHQAVIVFFVLSGFFIIKNIIESDIRKRWNFKDYTINRLTRLWVVLIPALLFGLFFDKIGLLFFSDRLAYSNQIRFFLDLNVAEKLQPSIFVGNIFFLQHILVPEFGSNGPLWSLANEFWYYVLFPIIYFSVVKLYRPLARICLIISAILISIFVGQEIIYFFGIWLMGGLSYIIYKRKDQSMFSSGITLLFLLLSFVGILLMTRLKLFPYLFNDFSLGFSFCLLIPCLINARMSYFPLKRISTYLSNISYTLYCVHIPVLLLVSSAFSFQLRPLNLPNLIIYVGLAILLLLYATLMWYFFERNTAVVRKWLQLIEMRLTKALKTV